MSENYTGSCKWYSKERGYGFITPDNPNFRGDVFLHASALTNSGIGHVVEGQRLSFVIKEKPNGRIQAQDIKVI